MRRHLVRLVLATFERDLDANLASRALAGSDGVLALKVWERQPASDGGPAYAVVAARVVPSLRNVVRQTAAKHGGQVVIDLGDELDGGSKRSR